MGCAPPITSGSGIWLAVALAREAASTRRPLRISSDTFTCLPGERPSAGLHSAPLLECGRRPLYTSGALHATWPSGEASCSASCRLALAFLHALMSPLALSHQSSGALRWQSRIPRCSQGCESTPSQTPLLHAARVQSAHLHTRPRRPSLRGCWPVSDTPFPFAYAQLNGLICFLVFALFRSL